MNRIFRATSKNRELGKANLSMGDMSVVSDICEKVTVKKKKKSEFRNLKHSFISNIKTQKPDSFCRRGFFSLCAPVAVSNCYQGSQIGKCTSIEISKGGVLCAPLQGWGDSRWVLNGLQNLMGERTDQWFQKQNNVLKSGITR